MARAITPSAPDGVFQARLADGIVYLDLEADTYSFDYETGPAGGSDAPEPAAPVWQDLPHAASSRPSLASVLRFLVALAATLLFFGTTSLARQVALARRRHVGRHADAALYGQVLARFEHLCLYLPFRIQCLFRAQFLLRFLAAHGLAADWIFGVSAFPFEAHCWVAADTVLLGERRERIACFAPILVVEPTRI
ncbi:lasso peptide biosynthesis B2 protein [Sphingomonas sp. AP4-R1]|uniref:lasso peptide biosynthesis B2 protein n=1 Tax=Sphingomonas sp. AP4-R1 TaxID=2735134 RepID=UPI00149377FD|nr:lasso peptide biosynthesis B2 protein [Sphingomonas sp. AP4-R1]QJU60080.1 lasso peptide biosynthesis B2 protein [Sphingomonas sp. AP4-R1]